MLLILIIVLASCSSTSSTLDAAGLEKLQSQLNSTPHKIIINTVYPQNTTASQEVINNVIIRTGNSANRIDVAGEGNYLSIANDSVTSQLPFFGEQRISAGYSNDMGMIEMSDVITDKVQYQIEDKTLVSKFTARGKNSESFNVTVRVNSPESVNLIINGSHKAFIRYTGGLEFLDTDE